MSKYLIEFVMKRSIEIHASSLAGAIEEATTWINHDEFLEKHKIRDLGFKITGIKTDDAEAMDYGPTRDF